MTVASKAEAQLEALLDYLHSNRGPDFRTYKRPSVTRRITKRMQVIGIKNFGDYLDYLEVHPEEFTPLLNTILINVTAFFRDRETWTYLAHEIVPRIIQGKKADEPIRIWSVGCASGEEAFSVAMVVAEALGMEAFRQRVRVYATDLDEDSLNLARQASYGAKDLAPVPGELSKKYFERTGSRHLFRTDLRRSIIFGRHDLVHDAPISRLDLLVCRNTLMYFNAEAQGHVLGRFHYALNRSGFLFLGQAEMLLTHPNLFIPINLKHRIFAKVSQDGARDRQAISAEAVNFESGGYGGRPECLGAAFDTGQTAQVVVDIEGNLTLANRRACSLFGLNSKDLGRPFQDLELSYRPADLRSLIERAYSERRPAIFTDVEKHLKDGDIQHLDVEVVPLQDDNGGLLGASITFNDVSRYHQLQAEIRRAKQEAERVNEELEAANQELQTTNEELQSTNEELQTTNEELQSTNEELETTNEELQSTNEELETTNEELQSTNEELDTTNEELRTLNEAVRQSEEQFRLLIEDVKDYAILMLDPEGTVISWNKGAERLKGYRQEEIIGKDFSCFYPREEIERGRPRQELKVAEAKGRSEDEGWRLRKDGSRFWAIVTITAIRDESGQLRGFSKITRNVTERKKADEALRSSDAQFHGLLEFAPDAIVGVDRHGRIAVVNTQTEKLFGYSRDELLGQAIEILIPERFRGAHIGHRATYISAPRARPMGSGLDLYGQRKDGSEFPVEISLGPMETDERLLVTAVIRDVTERKEAEELERRLIVSDRLVSLGEIAASVAHEFNNPLTAILGFSQDMLSELKPAHEYYQPVKVIDEEARRCKKFVQDLLDLVRPRHPAFDLVDIGEIVRTTLGILSTYHQRRNIKTSLDLQPELPLIFADPQQLEQVLINLCFNAAEAMPDGGVLGVRVRAKPESPSERRNDAPETPREIVVEVADTGAGIDPSNLPKVFRPFFTTKEKKGMGLGLSVCKRIVAGHNGRIEVASAPGGGTTFTIHLPAGGNGNP